MSKGTKIKGFRILAAGVRILSILLAMVVASNVITSVHIFHQLSNEHSLWEKMPNHTCISFGMTDGVETDQALSDINKFCREMEQTNNLSLSLVIDQSVFLEPPEYGGYDHIIITNKEWADSFDVGVGQKGKGGELTPVSFQTLSEPLQKFLEDQIPIWTRSKTVQPEGMGYYEFTGEQFLGLPPNVEYSGTTIQAKNPLIILVDSPASTFETKAFLQPLISSGNIVFPNKQTLLDGLAASSLGQYVNSVYTIADAALSQEKLFGKEAVFYTAAWLLLVIAMVAATIMEAWLWTEANKKRIFAGSTGGKTCFDKSRRAFYGGIAITMIVSLVGGAISYLLTHSNLIALLGGAVVIILLYGAASFLAYRRCGRSAVEALSKEENQTVGEESSVRIASDEKG